MKQMHMKYATLMQYFIQMSRIVVPMLILLSIKNKRYFTFLLATLRYFN